MGLHSAPIVVGDVLAERLFSRTESSILTSATLSIDSSFDYIREHVGLPDASGLLCDSPFDFTSAAMLYLPTDIADPDRPAYQAQLAESLVRVCSAAGGRTLVLFTAHSQLRQCWGAIKRPLEERDILVLAHGVDGISRRNLLQSFKTNPRSVLLGASSFWEGVDVVGDALSVLVIAKLPFAVPTDPVVAARGEQYEDPFTEFSLPQAVLRFKQGFGRLIRSSNDRGVAIVFDRRVQTRSYGRLFLDSLPPATVRRGPIAEAASEVTTWLAGGLRARGSVDRGEPIR